METQSSTSSSELQPARVVHFTDGNGETLLAEVVIELEMDGIQYGLLTQKHPPILILREDLVDEDAPYELVSMDEFAKIERDVQKALSDHGLKLKPSGDMLTLTGNITSDFLQESQLIEIEGENQEITEYLILVEVDDASHQFMVVLSCDPEIFPCELLENDQARLLSGAELDGLEGVFEAVLAEGFGEEEEEEEE
jgi:hypothetical protein